MRIMLVTNLYPNPIEPNRGIFIFQIFQHVGMSHTVDIATPIPYFPNHEAFRFIREWHNISKIPENYQIEGFNVSTVRYPYLPKVGGFFHSDLMFWPLYKKIRKLHSRNHYDCLFSSWVFPDGVAATRVADRLEIPIVLNALGCDINLYSRSWVRRAQIQKALRNADGVITVSKNLFERVIELGTEPSKVTNIANGVDLEIFQPRGQAIARKKLGLEPSTPVILFVGSLEEVKGVDTLLEAIRWIKKSYAGDFNLLMAGNGPWRGMLERRVNEYSLGRVVKLLGAIRHEEIPTYMNAANVFCLPSIREGHPNVVNEALASGIPVVATRVGAIPDLIREETGIVVPSGEPRLLGMALVAAIERNWDCLAIRRSVEDQSWALCASRYSSVIERVARSYLG